MFNNTISLTQNKKNTDSYGRILGNKCKRVKLVDLTCTSIQKYRYSSSIFQDKGWEGGKEVMRFDSKFTDFSIIQNLSIADYIEYTDVLGKRHEYKIIDFETRTILGCTWVTLYGENLAGRDILNTVHKKEKVTAIP